MHGNGLGLELNLRRIILNNVRIVGLQGLLDPISSPPTTPLSTYFPYSPTIKTILNVKMKKPFTLTELKRLKYTKMKSGMSEQEANQSLKELVDFQNQLQDQKPKKKLGRPSKKDINANFKEKFKELTHGR